MWIETAAQPAGSMTDGKHDLEAVSRALVTLRLAPGDVYMLDHDERRYWAVRPDRPSTGILRAGTPEELGKLLTGDFVPEPS